MKLRDIDFGPCQDASGVRGWFGEGYWWHRYLRRLGLDFAGCTFVAKTTTLGPREGNMPIWLGTLQPREWVPKCIVVKPVKGVVLNAVGLSGPGAGPLLSSGRWQKRTEPFFLSFMSVAETRAERTQELDDFVRQLGGYLSGFDAPIGLQINFSCPNVGLNPLELVEETKDGLSTAGGLGIPLVPKFNVLLPPAAAVKLQPFCDAICVSNTIPYGKLASEIDWGRYFGRDPLGPDDSSNTFLPFVESPLAELGGGGLSGAPLLPLVAEWVKVARKAGFTKPIVAGGGILRPRDVDVLARAGADAVALGSIAILRGWRLRKTIKRSHELLGTR